MLIGCLLSEETQRVNPTGTFVIVVPPFDDKLLSFQAVWYLREVFGGERGLLSLLSRKRPRYLAKILLKVTFHIVLTHGTGTNAHPASTSMSTLASGYRASRALKGGMTMGA